MNRLLNGRPFLMILLWCGCMQSLKAQFLIEMIDTTTRDGKGVLSRFKKYDHVRISGYMQPQFQVAQEKGIKNYSGGDFPAQSNNRFMFRRGRIRFDYADFTETGLPLAQVVFQFDGTERGVFIRDFWGRLYESKWQVFSFTTGMFARPFGYEVNMSSSDRETPERGRMSQILMKTERDLGVMVTFEPRKAGHPLKNIKLDLGIFNGQGLAGPSEYDNYKDIIGRISLKPYQLKKNLLISAGASLLQGGIVQNSRYIYHTSSINGSKSFLVDSSLENFGAKAPRKYHGIDAQLKLKHAWGVTELRGEFWFGKQTATGETSETPGELLENTPYYIRPFNGAFFYFLQNIVNEKHQLGFKYDWYDPNTEIEGENIGLPATNTGEADIKYSTVSLGYNFYYNDNFKLLLWYDIIRSEKTSLPNFAHDIRDNVFTCRIQYSF